MRPDLLLSAAQLGFNRSYSRETKQCIQKDVQQRLTEVLAPTGLPEACKDIDKVFCSVWLDQDNVLIGTKCNKLRKVHLPTRTWEEVAYPAQPVHRLGPDLFASANRVHCGQHGLAVSPSGAYLVTGGTAVEDMVLWRLQHPTGNTSKLAMQPLQTFMGHADWVFGMSWLSDKHWVSGSRDGTVKLWQVPETAADANYSVDPACALLSVAYHVGKVRDIKYDQQQRQVVTLATDATLSWWTPDLQLKGSCRLSDAVDVVTLATCGDLVAVGSVGRVDLLDTRAPNAGLKRSNSSDSLPSSKRSRLPHSWAAAMMLPGAAAAATTVTPASAAAAAATARPAFVSWLPPAYPRAVPVRPIVLALTGNVHGLMQVQTNSAAAGMDPVLAEQLLRQEAATNAVSNGRPFDTELQCLVVRLLQLRPGQQQQELAALQHKHALGCQPPMQVQQLQQALRPQQLVEQAAGAHLFPAQSPLLVRVRPLAQQQELLQQQQQLQHGSSAGAGLNDSEDEASNEDSLDDGWEDFESGDMEEQWVQDGRNPAADLPNEVRYVIERSRRNAVLSGNIQRALQVQQQLLLQRVPPFLPGQLSNHLQARVSGKLFLDKSVVRSVSIHNHVLGVGHNGLDFFDLRRLEGACVDVGRQAPDSALLYKHLDMHSYTTCISPVLLEHGYGVMLTTESAVYSHSWDPTGTRMLAGGGPLALGCKGAFLQVLT